MLVHFMHKKIKKNNQYNCPLLFLLKEWITYKHFRRLFDGKLTPQKNCIVGDFSEVFCRQITNKYFFRQL